MILVGENIHIISKTVRNAIETRDTAYITELITAQSNMDFIDLNVGPSRGKLEGSLSWLAELVQQNSDAGISLDTTNADEMEAAFEIIKNPTNCFINSTSKDEPRLSVMTNLAAKYDCNLIALTMGKETGIPKSADGRLEIAMEIESQAEIKNTKLYFDPLVLPLCVDQSQAMEVLNTIQMIKQSFESPVKTIVGLSNISNGMPKELRPIVNRVFAVLAYGAGLDAAIIDAKDRELVRILRILETQTPRTKDDETYIELANMIANFSDIEDLSSQNSNIIRTARVLLNKEIYSPSVIV